MGLFPRITIQGSIYYQPNQEDDAHEIPFSWSRKLETDEQPYIRVKKLSSGVWEEVQTDWIESPAYLIIENLEESLSLFITFSDCKEERDWFLADKESIERGPTNSFKVSPKEKTILSPSNNLSIMFLPRFIPERGDISETVNEVYKYKLTAIAK